MSFELSEFVEHSTRVNELLCSVSDRWIEEATETGTLFSQEELDAGLADELQQQDKVAPGGAQWQGQGPRPGLLRSFGPSPDHSYLSPTDLGKGQCQASGLASQHASATTEEATGGDDPPTWIKSLHQLQAAALALHSLGLQAPRGGPVRRLLMHFPHCPLPPSTPVCPSLPQVRNLLTSGELNVTVHSTAGYDFSAEFARVYEGQSTPKTWFEDFTSICKRAIVAIDSSTPDDR